MNRQKLDDLYYEYLEQEKLEEEMRLKARNYDNENKKYIQEMYVKNPNKGCGQIPELKELSNIYDIIIKSLGRQMNIVELIDKILNDKMAKMPDGKYICCDTTSEYDTRLLIYEEWKDDQNSL